MAPKITWFGDDFTGAAAVMEVLALAGIDAVLFSEIPDPGLFARFAGSEAIGIASTARAEGPEWMDANLPAAFEFLKAAGAPVLHYKVCSTFDSAPHSGSIGRAAEIGLRATGARAAPMLTAAPGMRRYQAFGNLFAGTPEGVRRLDRHPVMSRHPVTPMDEADLLAHLAGQTDLESGLIDLEALSGDAAARLGELLGAGVRILSIDCVDADSEAAAGRLIWDNREDLSFVIGSQGVEYALVRHWREEGAIPPAPPLGTAGKVDRIAVVSGSVSPHTASQIGWAEGNGFSVVRFDAAGLVADPGRADELVGQAVSAAVEAASDDRSPLVCSAAGPEDTAVEAVRSGIKRRGVAPEEANKAIGMALGRVLDGILDRSGIRRAVISGGDTSGHGMNVLGIKALRTIAHTVPGASLCIGHGGSRNDGLEIALKGGQMGTMDYFGWIRDGGGPRREAG